ncbi:MAG TPA: ABC transporter ATP-binding protein [Candidatus Eisenbacteria bacterium]|nr:ABC transporter ATP-binding protein [Candidatus Eisenbacteria bacterium]
MDRRDPMVRLENVERQFEQGAASFFALRRLSLEVGRGEWLSVMGPSGAGKSTLLAILGLQDTGWTGGYWLKGEAVHQLPLDARARLRAERIGFVFQSYHLLDDLTVYENLEVPLAYRDLSRSERAARVAHALDRFGLAARRDLRPNQLSGGQQQLVAVARALVGGPSLLLADEPTGSLHSDQAHEVMQLFRRLHEEGTTIVQVTHSREVAAWSERVVTLRDGWIVDEPASRGTSPATATSHS